ncbi:hypothetical protein DENSPDRAFT_840122 [Dentipellis sp. KUC8613]|nr:hypothetical protein DENSPDRAFT_840122 [Dentipellis sp. KUC8613]
MSLSTAGAVYFGDPEDDPLRRALERQNAASIRGLFLYMQKQYSEARQQHQHAYDVARTSPLSPESR